MTKKSLIIIALVGAALWMMNRHSDQDLPRKKHGTEKLFPAEDFFLMKQFPETKFHIRAYEKALKNINTFVHNGANRSAGLWQVEGPGNIGARANTIAVNPKDPNHILIGYSEGGIFMTRDGGTNWQPVFDKQLRLSIGDIVFDPNNSSIVYAGTGDPNISGYPFIGNGIYKSTDGGTSWSYIGLDETRVISQIRVSSQDANVIYVGAMGLPFEKNNDRGLYKSTNGGQSWQQILFVNDSTGIADLVIHPQNHNIVYATAWNRIRNNYKSLVSGPDAHIYKSVDGGQNWKILEGGLPTDASSRIGIDIAASNPNVLYACYTDATTFDLKDVFRSDDGGETWQSVGGGVNPDIYGGFGWYFGKIRINPKDANDVFLLGVEMFRSKDGGQSWVRAVPPWWLYDVHADKHDLIFSEDKMYLTTDGGAYSADITGEIWTKIENIPTTQFYRVGYNPHKPHLFYGGAQDNGTSGGNKDSINVWQRVFGGDGFQMLFHPLDSLTFYVETQNGGLYVTDDGGDNFDNATDGLNQSEPKNWDMPIIMSKHNSEVLYTGTDRIYRNETGKDVFWVAISPPLTDLSSGFLRHNISAIHASDIDENLIAAGTSDGLLWLTDDGGQSWKNISSNLPQKYISSICFSPEDDKTLYVTYTGYKDNDNTPYIYRSNDLGANWQPVQGNMPAIAINNVLALEQKNKANDILFIATDAGVFYTKDHKDWLRLGENMPLIAVYDVEYNEAKNLLIAGTFGRSIQSIDLKQISYPETIGVSENELTSVGLVSNLVANDQPLVLINPTRKIETFVVTNVFGQVIMQIQPSVYSTEVDINHLAPGHYFIYRKDTKAKGTRFIKI